uniref:Uncharacterized protein n=1 Tax=Arundo donax TaxID=35708 RepID=A0A0A9HK70_ARUDO
MISGAILSYLPRFEQTGCELGTEGVHARCRELISLGGLNGVFGHAQMTAAGSSLATHKKHRQPRGK